MMNARKFVFAACVAGSLLACDKESNIPARSFKMGFTPFPYEVSEEAVDFVYQHIAKEADIIDHHFDNGVPWVEAYDDKPFHDNIMNDWKFRKDRTSANQTIYVSVAALRITRDSLANYRGQYDDMPLPKPWNTYGFNDVHVKHAYLNYCKRIISYFNPQYFNMSVEGNLLYYINPSLWTDYMDFHRYIYTELKKLYPNLMVFSSVTGAHIMPGFFEGNDYVQQRLAALQMVEYSDMYAVSFYPYLSGYVGNDFPENTFDELFNLSDKPFAVAETGYPAQTFSIKAGTNDVMIISDNDKQNKYINNLFKAAQKRKAQFVINFVLRDYDALWKQTGSKNDLSIAWRDSGLYSENGLERPSLVTWKKFFNYQHSNQK
jgi:hypothetical protein